MSVFVRNAFGLGSRFNFSLIKAKHKNGLNLYYTTWFLQKRLAHSSRKLQEGPSLKDFISPHIKEDTFVEDVVPYITPAHLYGRQQKVCFEVYGCQMNVNDTEIVWSILKCHGYIKTESVADADVILLVTCAIREGAETKIWERLNVFRGMKNRSREKRRNLKIGILGCMAERLKHKVLEIEKSVDLVAGPDSYKDLPRLLSLAKGNQEAVNVLLSLDETYADVTPVRLNENSVTAFVSIMRGCDNMCTYCIVPFTRGRERSRPMKSILDEVSKLSDSGVKEITLLGQNVNSYRDTSSSDFYPSLAGETKTVPGFKTVYKPKQGGVRFDVLLDHVSRINPNMRVRFTSPHPKDFPNEVLNLIRERDNICACLHLPAQSGSTAVLERMRRGYTRDSYLALVDNVRSVLPNASLTSDFICGFCGETEDEFKETLSLLEDVRFNFAYLFAYSMREKTTAHRRFTDDVPQYVKLQRCTEMTHVFRESAKKVNAAQIGQLQLVLVEGLSKKSSKHLAGRNDGNTKVIMPQGEIPTSSTSSHHAPIQVGDYVVVMINAANSQLLKGIPLYHSSVTDFVATVSR